MSGDAGGGEQFREAADLSEQVIDNLLHGDGFWFEVERKPGRHRRVVPLVPVRDDTK